VNIPPSPCDAATSSGERRLNRERLPIPAMDPSLQNGHLQNGHLRKGLQELSRYLIYLRVPLLLAAVAGVVFLTQQVRDVLLAMALEPEWGAFGMAALFAGVFGVLLWLSARSLSELRWMRPPRRRKGEAGAVARPKVRAIPAAVVWWLPRLLGITPPLLLAMGLALGVGPIGMGPAMVLLLVLEAAALLALLYLRTRLPRHLPLVSRSGIATRAVEALTTPSGVPDGLFTPRTELLLMALAWMALALISVPIAAAAYGPFGGGSLHLYGLLLGGALVLAFWRRCGAPRPRAYWITFAALLLLALLVPPVVQSIVPSGVAVPRLLGSIAILYSSLSIFLVFASTFFAFGVQTGIPLLSLLLAGALLLGSFRFNDNHAVRLLSPPPTATPAERAGVALPALEQAVERWLAEEGRAEAIRAEEGKPWPIYVVSAQGGGVYAAYHASKALALLTREVPDFPRHLFAISGVSGGSVGAVLYANALEPGGDNHAIVQRIDQAFDRDHLSPVLAAMLFPDTTQRFYPWPVPAWDRALGLELTFSDTRAAASSDGDTPAPISLETSFYDEGPGPFLVLNTTEVASGRRFLLSPFRFRSDATFHEPSRSPEERNRRQDVRFSTAAGMSARFPLISPYAFFDGTEAQRQRRTVDGGYYDNSGAVTAGEIISGLNRVLASKGLADRVEVIPIAIVNRSSFLRVSDTDRQETAEPVQVSTPRPLLSLSALDALFATRDARLSKTLSDVGVRCGQRNDDGLCITLGQNYRIADVPEAAARVRSIPLGWTLSCQARAFISSQLDPDPASARRSAAGGEQASRPAGAADLPCLRHQRQPLRLEAAAPSENFPSFAAIVERVREGIVPGSPALDQ
jgi:hypothetical protein